MAEFVSCDFSTIRNNWVRLYSQSQDVLLFSSPDWSELWWQYFGVDSTFHLGAVNHEGRCIGIAPLRIKEHTAYFIGSDDVCDFLDFIIEPGMEPVFFTTVLSHLAKSGIEKLNLSCLLPGSSVRRYFIDNPTIDKSRITWSQADIAVSLDLPGDLSSYQAVLSSKQRHELLRKERRLNEEGGISYKVSEKADVHEIDIFMQFFRESREDKNKFLTGRMEEFLRAVINNATINQWLRLGALELNNIAVAFTLGFDYQDCMYLYNSGYNPSYKWLSVGLLSKYYFIKYSIECSKSRFDFLKGNEKYKFHLGGKEIPLFRCIIKTFS